MLRQQDPSQNRSIELKVWNFVVYDAEFLYCRGPVVAHATIYKSMRAQMGASPASANI